jgi:hypothetical protein
MPRILSVALAILGLAVLAHAPSAAANDDLRSTLEALRSDVNGFKVRTLNDVMSLSTSEAERFWPLYREYEKDQAAVADRRVALIQQFGELRMAGALDAAAWDSLAKKWLANAQARVDLWKRYQKKIAKAVSPMRAAQFLQIEHQMALFVDLSIASEMPVLGQAPR